MAVVEFLINSGADIDAQDNAGETALFKAASFNSKNMVRLLIDRGADPGIEAFGGRTAADTRYHEVSEMVAEAVERRKLHALKAAAAAKVATAEKKRHDAVSSRQQSLKAHAPKLRLKTGPKP